MALLEECLCGAQREAAGDESGETDMRSSQRTLGALLRNSRTMLSGYIVHLSKLPKIPSGTRQGEGWITNELNK